MTYKISVDYKKSLDQLVKKSAFDWKYIFDGYELPKDKGPKEVTIELLHFGKTITSEEVPKEVEAQGYRLVTFREALELSIQHPDLQRQYWLSTLENEGQLCYLFLGGGGGQRGLRVRRGSPGGHWDDDFRFLVVRKFSEPGKLGASESFDPLALEISYKGTKYKLSPV